MVCSLTGRRKTFNRLVIHMDLPLAVTVMTYSLDILARLALDKSQLHSLDASIERVGGNDAHSIVTVLRQIGRAHV